MNTINNKESLSDFLKNNFYMANLLEAAEEDYNIYPKYKNKKVRIIEEPKERRKVVLKDINEFLQENFPCPTYCFAGWKGRNNIKNAKEHLGKTYFLTADVEKFFNNSTRQQVFAWAKEQGLAEQWAKTFADLSTCNNHLSTGSPISMILAMLIHQEIFDEIQRFAEISGMKFTLFVDDMTLSSNKPISQDCIKQIEKILAKHNLHINKSKIKRFGFKGARITGVILTKNKKLDIPFKKNLEIINILKQKDVSDMVLDEVQILLGKVGYIQQIHPNRFKATKFKAIGQLKKLTSN